MGRRVNMPTELFLRRWMCSSRLAVSSRSCRSCSRDSNTTVRARGRRSSRQATSGQGSRCTKVPVLGLDCRCRRRQRGATRRGLASGSARMRPLVADAGEDGQNGSRRRPDRCCCPACGSTLWAEVEAIVRGWLFEEGKNLRGPSAVLARFGRGGIRCTNGELTVASPRTCGRRRRSASCCWCRRCAVPRLACCLHGRQQTRHKHADDRDYDQSLQA